jgi:hypothetical protein
MIEWLVAYVESLGYTALVGGGYLIMRKKDGNNYFDVDFYLGIEEANLDTITKQEAMQGVDRCINMIVQMMSMAHREKQGEQQ